MAAGAKSLTWSLFLVLPIILVGSLACLLDTGTTEVATPDRPVPTIPADHDNGTVDRRVPKNTVVSFSHRQTLNGEPVVSFRIALEPDESIDPETLWMVRLRDDSEVSSTHALLRYDRVEHISLIVARPALDSLFSRFDKELATLHAEVRKLEAKSDKNFWAFVSGESFEKGLEADNELREQALDLNDRLLKWDEWAQGRVFGDPRGFDKLIRQYVPLVVYAKD